MAVLAHLCSNRFFALVFALTFCAHILRSHFALTFCAHILRSFLRSHFALTFCAHILRSFLRSHFALTFCAHILCSHFYARILKLFVSPIESAFKYPHQLNRNESSNGFHILRSHFKFTYSVAFSENRKSKLVIPFYHRSMTVKFYLAQRVAT